MNKTAEKVRELLRDSAGRISLDEMVSEQIDVVIQRTSREELSHNDAVINAETVSARINAYEAAVSDVATTVALIARWGIPEHMPTLARVFSQVGDANDHSSGIQQWVGLSWLPFFILEYSAGIAAISANRYEVLGIIHGALASKRDYDDPMTAVARAVARMSQAGRDDALKLHPEYARRGPRVSNYLAKALRCQLGDVVAIGSEFDLIFDRFEVLDTMSHYSRQTPKRRVYSPPGRFVWKAVNHVSTGDPLMHLEAEAREEGDAWGPTKAGLFAGSSARFLELAEQYRTEYWSHLVW